jgi:Late exocytosis, associated with Golgi transport
MNATTTDGNVPSNNTQFVTRILLNSLQVYGSILAIGLVLYCWLRKQIPRTFAIRQWVPSCQTTLANNSFGYFSWLWKVYSFSEDDLMEHVALDAACFLRVINLGF